MGTAQIDFVIESGATGRRILELLQKRFRTIGETRPHGTTTYYDTFDWRLYRKGGCLGIESDEGKRPLTWRSIDGTVRCRSLTTTDPSFARDLPDGRFRRKIERIIGVRRLLPIVQVKTSGRRLRILDDNEKPVAFVDLEAGTAHAPGESSDGRQLGLRLRLTAVEGYEAWRAEIARFIERECNLPQAESGCLHLALAAIGREPGDYSSKLDIPLTPEMRTDEAAKRILGRLLEAMLRNEDGTRQDLDPEFLHDFRVAVRRTRTCLAQIKRIFSSALVKRTRGEFAWLGEITGPTRDLDVYLESMTEYRAGLPEGDRQDLEPLHNFLRMQQGIEQRRMADALDSERYRKLVSDWTRFLAQEDSDRSSLPRASRPVLETARERIRSRYNRVLKKGAEIRPDSPISKLHRLRIDCKKLRYLLEFFRSLFSPGDLGILIRTLKDLQDNLGTINDLKVQQDALVRIAREMEDARSATPRLLMAMGRMVERLEIRRNEERGRFEKRFATFSGKGARARLERLLASSGGEKA